MVVYSFPVILAKLTKGLLSRIQKRAKSHIIIKKSTFSPYFHSPIRTTYPFETHA